MVIESTPPAPSEAEATGVDVLLGITVAALRLADRTANAAAGLLSDAPPIIRPIIRQLAAPAAVVRRWALPDDVLRRIAVEGRRQRAALVSALDRELRVQIPRIVDLVLDEIDLTELVKDKLDLDAVAREIDVDALIGRIDLIGLARYVIEGVDLPEIVRDSTGSIASEGVRSVRMQTINADERVNRVVDRLLLRHRARDTAPPSAPHVAPADDGGAR